MFADMTHLDEMDSTVHAKPLSPGTLTKRAAAEGFLKGFVDKYAAKEQWGIASDDVLCRGSAVTLVENRRFWKMLCATTARRSARYLVAAETQTAEKTKLAVQNDMTQLYGAYERMSGLSVARSVRDECTALNQQRSNAPEPREKEQATFSNLHAIITRGIFSRQSGMRIWRERVQSSLMLLLLAYTAARPGELVRNADYDDCLRWKDVTFFLTLVTDEQARSYYRLSCDVKIRNLKGMRADTTAFRTQPLYMSDGLPRCMDAAVLLAVLAIKDGLFGSIDISKVVHGEEDVAISALFPPGCDTIEIPVEKSKEHQFVFRQVQPSTEGDKAPAEEPTAVRSYGIADKTAWSYSNARTRISRAATIAGFPNFHFRSWITVQQTARKRKTFRTSSSNENCDANIINTRII